MSQNRNGGPYTKEEQEKRKSEVYRLHFEYGYSSRKIAELMKVNRNTINGDINYWYTKLSKNSILNPESITCITNERLDIQRTRLRELLDKAITIQENLSIEKLIYEIDSKLASINQRISESTIQQLDGRINSLNNYLKSIKSDQRYLSLSDKMMVSANAFEKINKIIEDDKKKLRGKLN